LEDFEGSIVVIAASFVILDIAVVDIVVHSFVVSIAIVLLLALRFRIAEVILQCWIFAESDGLEFPIGVEAKDGAKRIIEKAEDGSSIGEAVHSPVLRKISLILDGSQKEDHEINSKEYADECEDHYYLIAQLMLDYVQQKKEEDSENCLAEEVGRCHEVQG
jgi:hypothetical protein